MINGGKNHNRRQPLLKNLHNAPKFTQLPIKLTNITLIVDKGRVLVDWGKWIEGVG